MAEKISLSQLAWRAFEGALSKEELSTYFLPDEARSRSLAPAVKLNPDVVETDGRRPTARTVNELRAEAEGARLWRNQRPGHAAKTKVLTEGDSWFNLPDLFFLGYPPDAVDILAKTHDVWPVAYWGDEIADMVSPGRKVNYIQPLKSGLFSHFLFSAGGNDVLAGIGQHVKPSGASGTNQNKPESFIQRSFREKVAEIIGHYRTLHKDVREASPKTVLYVHGYANAIPRPGGPFIGSKLEQLGFDAGSQLATGIVAALVQIFNDELKRFADGHHRVVYVDLRPVVRGTDWHTDEIHPNKTGARKIAQAFAHVIAQNVPVG